MKPIKQYIDEEMVNCPLTIMQEEKLLKALDRYITTELEANKNFIKSDVIKSVCECSNPRIRGKYPNEYCTECKKEVE
jgi:hypothetical protein